MTTESETMRSYRGLEMRASDGVHEEVARVIQDYAPQGARVLDVGAGTGALSRRLADLGFAVRAVDVDIADWGASEVPISRLDVNAGLAASVDGRFDVVCCVEVMEHVENPWQLVRDVHALLVPNGIAVFTTPNVTSFVSRVEFLRNGVFGQFSKESQEYGHINPVADIEFRLIADRVGLMLVESQPAGYLPLLDFRRIGLRSLARNAMRLIAYGLARGQRDGWCLLYVLRKPLSDGS